MERWLLCISTLLIAMGGVAGVYDLLHGKNRHSTTILISIAFLFQSSFLVIRGQMRGACPLGDSGEILAYLTWALSLFYLLVGPAYRISLLGIFTCPLVVFLQVVALLPQVMTVSPTPVLETNPWHETHSATSVLAYGALALAAVAGVMFLVLDRFLKRHFHQNSLFRGMPPINELLVSLVRLLWLGCALLTIGIVAGFLMPHSASAWGHLSAAVVVWASYVILLSINKIRGLTGRKILLSSVILFVFSLVVFAFV